MRNKSFCKVSRVDTVLALSTVVFALYLSPISVSLCVCMCQILRVLFLKKSLHLAVSLMAYAMCESVWL